MSSRHYPYATVTKLGQIFRTHPNGSLTAMAVDATSVHSWCWPKESNFQHPEYKSGVLPIELSQQISWWCSFSPVALVDYSRGQYKDYEPLSSQLFIGNHSVNCYANNAVRCYHVRLHHHRSRQCDSLLYRLVPGMYTPSSASMMVLITSPAYFRTAQTLNVIEWLTQRLMAWYWWLQGAFLLTQVIYYTCFDEMLGFAIRYEPERKLLSSELLCNHQERTKEEDTKSLLLFPWLTDSLILTWWPRFSTCKAISCCILLPMRKVWWGRSCLLSLKHPDLVPCTSESVRKLRYTIISAGWSWVPTVRRQGSSALPSLLLRW